MSETFVTSVDDKKYEDLLNEIKNLKIKYEKDMSDA
jgi:hypothetical protein